MADPAANADQHAYWNGEVGDAWAAQQALMDVQLEPLGRAAMEALGPRRGERLLDVGCGSGATTLALAQAVGPGGKVTGVDVSRPMLAIARRRSPPAGGGAVAFEEADAQTCDFPPGGFDAIFSRFGVMFFADPVAAFTNIRKALAPAGRLAFVAWRPMEENPMFTAPLEAAGRRAPPGLAAPADPAAPGPFALADPSRTHVLLQAAGFREVATDPVDLEVSPGGVDEAVALGLAIGPLAARLRERPDACEAAAEDLRAAFAARARSGRVSFPAAVWVVTARA